MCSSADSFGTHGEAAGYGNCFSPLKHSAGFSLLEVMIALAIIATVLVTIIHTVNYQSNVAFEDTVITDMYLRAKQKLSDMESKPRDSSGQFPDTDYFFTATAKRVAGTGMIEIKATVSADGKEVSLRELIMEK